jgi:hypothetical protein
LVGEAGQDRGNDELEIPANLLEAESNGGGSKANQASVAGMRLMDSIGIVLAELGENGMDPGMVVGRKGIANRCLEPGPPVSAS